MLSPIQQQNLDAAAPEALAIESLCGLPAELTLAQWALESAWGYKSPGNNCFGIKKYPGCYGVQSLATVEWLAAAQIEEIANSGGVVHVVQPMIHDAEGRKKCLVMADFATFSSLRDCFQKRAILLTTGKRYAAAWAQFKKDSDLPGFINRMGRVYATDPEYADKVMKIAYGAAVTVALNKLRT